MDPHDAMLLTYRPTTVVSQASRLADTCPDLCGSSAEEEALFARPTAIEMFSGQDDEDADPYAASGMFQGGDDLAGFLPDKILGLPTVPVLIGVGVLGVVAFMCLRKKG
jgi:hypothetical protein